ncbi:MAG TPA: phosphoribosyltransferase [Vicinamibacterales bacterium]|jgi:predicted phosphoribosyltransferase
MRDKLSADGQSMEFAHRFRDRSEAGRLLAEQLTEYSSRSDVLVLALPRGGVPVALEIARGLSAPLDVFLVRKLGVPWHRELAMGAIASGGIEVLNDEVVRTYGIPRHVLDAVAEVEAEELERRMRSYRGDRPLPQLTGHVVVLVDDGIATGSTMRAAVAAIRLQQPAEVVVAVPVAAADTCDELRHEVDRLICLSTPVTFVAVGDWYEDFSQTSDDQVRALLAEAN